MRLICPNCDAQYEVADGAIPDEGRDVQCSNCGHAWFQLSPEALAAAQTEAEVFELPPEPDDVPEPEDELPPEVFEAPAPMPRRGIDDSLMAVLREEAEREVQARRHEEPQGIETQEELGLDAASAAVAVSPAARRIAQMKGIDAEQEAELTEAPAPEPAPVRQAARRELLPDIEEINSTLRPSDDRAGGDVGMAAGVQPSRTGFRSGFVLMMVLGVALVMAYVMAPRIAQQIPGAAPAMQGYVTAVDSARLWLDQIMQKAITGLENTGG